MSDLRSKFGDLCRELNMDQETEERSWKMYCEVSKRFSLEGEPVHWFCCALYTACRESITPTVGEPNAVVMGNCVSFTKLLKSCDMSIYQFITNCERWAEMANLPTAFIMQITRLKKTSSVTLCIFKNYNSIFRQLFTCPKNEKKHTKFRSGIKCSSNKLYDFGWCLYLCAKNKNPNVTVDLVTSFHLLICCIDYVYVNVLADNRLDLINPEFEGLPKNYGTPEFDIKEVINNGIIEALCHLDRVIPKKAKTMKEDCWKSIIKEFFEIKTLHGDPETFLGVIGNQFFEQNLKNLNSLYEQYVLSAGEFDETILLKNPSYRKIIGTEPEDVGRAGNDQDMKSLYPDTPYTGKHFLPVKDSFMEPVANATNSVKQLQEKTKHIYSYDFISFCSRSGDNVLQKLEKKLDSMWATFKAHYADDMDAAEERFNLARAMYYYLLDKIIQAEQRQKPNFNITELLETDKPNTTLLACCVEIVLDAYKLTNEDYKFPWLLRCFSINAYDFYKIIEPIVKNHDKLLTRPSIKHLNYIEETCLESLVWVSTSPIWQIIADSKPCLPTWSEVDVNKKKKQGEASCKPLQRDSAKRDLFNNNNSNNNNGKNINNNACKKAGSLALVLRKFYTLAWVRIKELCKSLDMATESPLDKIWTFFEYSITKKTDLMRDRHLDQILMCAIYLYIRVEDVRDKTFAEIMKNYRKQPQATSDTYRNVFIEWDKDSKAIYKDLIQFYNSIYVDNMRKFAEEYSEGNKSGNDETKKMQLSPHPPEKLNLPRKVSINHNVYVHTMEKSEVLNSPKHTTYEIGKSPAKVLACMNEVVKSGKKRIFQDGDDTDNAGSVITTKIPRETHCY